MSYEYNYKFWVATTNEISDLHLKQHALSKLQPITDEKELHRTIGDVYSDYLNIFNRLSYLYEVTLQVQKRKIIRNLLETTNLRLLELRNELKKIELSRFIYLDDVLIQKKIVAQDIQLLKPAHFPFERDEEIVKILKRTPEEWKKREHEEKMAKEAQKRLENINIKLKQLRKQLKREGKDPDEIEDTVNMERRRQIFALQKFKQAGAIVKIVPEAEILRAKSVILIQSLEKARQGRVWWNNIKRDKRNYAPVAPASLIPKYKFSHKHNSPMLIPVRKTVWDTNYYQERAEEMEFAFYVRPRDTMATIIQEEKLEPNEESVLQKSDPKAPIPKKEQMSHFTTETNENNEEEEEDLESIEEEIIRDSELVLLQDKSARVIQRAWRHYKWLKTMDRLALKRKAILGMIDQRKPKSDFDEKMRHRQELIRRRKRAYDEMFMKACNDEKARILKIKSLWIMEDITDHIRYWLQQFYNATEDFPKYPPALKGGTILVLREEVTTIEEHLAQKNKPPLTPELKKILRDRRRLERQKARREKKIQKQKAKVVEETAKKKDDECFNCKTFVKNEYFKAIDEQLKQYQRDWIHVNEIVNYKELPYMEWITEEKFAEVHQELRAVVDEQMRIEYELLKMALAKDLHAKYMPLPREKQSKKKAVGKKKEKDYTAKRSLDSLYYEMLNSDVIKKWKQKGLDNFIGDYNYMAFEGRNTLYIDPPPSLGEVKDVLREWLVGFGPLDIARPKSMLIVGPIGTGRRILTKMIATEIDAVVFDLSPEIVMKYENNLDYLLHVVLKLSRIFQPSIIFIHCVERLWAPEVSPDDVHSKMKLLTPRFKEILKSIRPEDRILVVATSSEPWLGGNNMKSLFQKILLLPRTDYGSTFLLWRWKMFSYPSVPRDFELSALARLTRNYSTGDILKNIEETLSVQRRSTLNRQKLDPREFLENLIERPDPNWGTEERHLQKYTNWFESISPMEKARKKKLAKAREDYLKAKKAKENQQL